jgi:lipopolysaccharide transport system permease protein
LPETLRHYLEVLQVLAERDFKVRYRNSVLGFIWSLLNPLGYMLIISLVFSLLLRSNITNFPAWVLIAILVWRFFSIGTSQGLSSIVGNASLVSKVYISRYVIVLSSNLANFFGSILEFIVMLPLLLFLGVNFSPYVLFLPIILILEFMLVYGLSLALSSLNLKFRDLYQIWDIVLQLGFFVCPIVYDPALVPVRYQLVYSLNPVTRLIESTRDILLSHRLPAPFDILVIIANIVVFMLIGFLIFRSLEVQFAEAL